MGAKRTIVLVIFALSLSSSFASSADPLNLASGPDAEIKKTVASEADKSMYKDLLDSISLLNDPKDQDKVKEGLEKLDNFIREHPTYSDAYFIRAMCLYGIAGSKQHDRIIEDLNDAIKYHSTTSSQSAYKDTAGMYGWRAKVYKANDNLPQAIKDLETAVNINHWEAIDHSGTSPYDEPTSGQWGKRDFDEIIRKYPKDYRGYLFRAIYYYNFGILLKPDDYKSAIADINKAISLNPKCSKAYYLLGEIINQRLMWSKKTEKEYRKEADVRLAGLSIWNAYPEECKNIANAYTNAIKANSRMKEAYLSRADLYLNTKKYLLAIKDYDKAIELDPDYGGAYHDRGLAHSNIGDYQSAIDDFTHAINAPKKINSIYYAYWNRAKAYASNNRFDKAIIDYTKAIELHTGDVIILMNLSQFRSIFPEYNDLNDLTLLAKLRDKYFPNMALDGFSELLLKEKAANNDPSGFEIYENRGDAYLKFGYYSKAMDDYKRASRVWPDYHMDRWKYVLTASKAKFYLDCTTVEKPNNNTYKFWLKIEHINAKPKAASYSVQNMAINCFLKKISTLSYIEYDLKGNVMHSSDSLSEWGAISPDTLGEKLYKGWCVN